MLEFVRRAAHHAWRLSGVRHRVRQVGDATFRYYHLGQGSHVVALIHGLGDSAVNWRWVAKAVAKGAEVVIPDLPGFGFSDLPAGRTSWNPLEYAEAVHEFLRPWHDRRPLLVGNSMGGWVASLLMLQYASCYRSTIMINPAGVTIPDPEPALRGFHDFLSTAEGRVILDRLIYNPAPYWRLIASGLERQMRAPVVQDFLSSLDHAHLLLAEQVRKLPAQCVLVWGEEDRFLPVGTGEAWMDVFPGAVVRLPQVAHMAQVERPERIARLIMACLQDDALILS